MLFRLFAVLAGLLCYPLNLAAATSDSKARLVEPSYLETHVPSMVTHARPTIYPVSINLSTVKTPSRYRNYQKVLLKTLSQDAVYQLPNGQLLSKHYRYTGPVASKDHRKTVLAFRKRNKADWGYVTTSIGVRAVANAFVIEQATKSRRYALVLKQMRICLVSGAEALPVWETGKWRFANSPGSFECTGSSKRNVFNRASGFPMMLGPYFSERDTVLVFDNAKDLKGMLYSLKNQFPQLNVPVINFPHTKQARLRLNQDFIREL